MNRDTIPPTGWDQAAYWQPDGGEYHDSRSTVEIQVGPPAPRPEIAPSASGPEPAPGRHRVAYSVMLALLGPVVLVGAVILGISHDPRTPPVALPGPTSHGDIALAPPPALVTTSPDLASPASPEPTPLPTPATGPTTTRPTTAQPAPPPPSSAPPRFKLVNRGTGKPIAVANGSTVDGATVVQVSNGASLAQQWRITDVGGGFSTVVNVNSGKALDNTDGSQTDGTRIQQWELIPGETNQQWRLTSLGGGVFLITNRTSGRALDLREGEVADGTVIQQWEANPNNPNQQWVLVVV